MRRIGVLSVGSGWWIDACRAASLDHAIVGDDSLFEGNLYAADLQARVGRGSAIDRQLSQQGVDFLLDCGGAGLTFAANPDRENDYLLLHERCGKRLVSHIIDPLVTTFQGLPWPAVWQCLQSGTWTKAVWDKAQARELLRFGVPNVCHLPMAAPDRDYDTTPIDPGQQRPVVAFVGGQNTTYFSSNAAVPTGSLLPGTIAHAVRGDLGAYTFDEIYHDLFSLGEAPQPDDEPRRRLEKIVQFYNAKLFFNAALCLRNRDRYVLFLARRLENVFDLVGTGWDKAYGIPCRSQYATTNEYLASFRQSAINLNFVNGNAETGLNMRHFEITASGGFMLCADQPELRECFTPGKECAVFTGESDLLEKIGYYLSHPAERADIALAGQRRTLRQHLYSHRLRKLITFIEDASGGGRDAHAESARDREPAMERR
ncbi:MAG: glycosyltransferase [Phycisphaerae bacterium]|nr:glycosyltransferase [Phycisphaerae bacterium]